MSSRLVDADYTPQPTSIYREENVEKDLSLNWQINTRVDSLQLLAPSRYTAAGAAPFFFFFFLFFLLLYWFLLDRIRQLSVRPSLQPLLRVTCRSIDSDLFAIQATAAHLVAAIQSALYIVQ